MLELKALCKKLEKRITILELENSALRQRVVILEQENHQLKLENQQLKRENTELRDKLGLNSKNSSIPSSKELYKLKRESKPKSDKKRGGQPGHKGHSRKRLEPNEIREVELTQDRCECGGSIDKSANPYVHQKIDIPPIKPYVIDYHVEHGRCADCGKRYSGDLPEEVWPGVFGPRIRALIASLSGFYKTSKADIVKLLKDICNLDISLGSITNSENKVSEKCKESYESLEEELSYSNIIHIDETSHYNQGKLGWCWVFSDLRATVLKLCKSRGKKELNESFIGEDDGHIVVSDRYGAYTYFAEETRQNCWSHLERDFERFANSHNPEVKVVGVKLVIIAQELFRIKRALLCDKLDKISFLRRARKLKKWTRKHLNQIAHNASALRASRVANNILKSENMMWKFMEDPLNIPLTNNHAERQIRHYVIYRKTSYFTQSDKGERFLERIMSLYLTWKQRGQNPYNNLLQIMLA